MWWFLCCVGLILVSYCSTIAGTRPHFPAVYTCPPSTAIASASLRCRMIKTTDYHRQTPQNGAKKTTTTKKMIKLVADSHIFIQECFTIIFFRHSSTVGAFWHSMAVASSPTLLMLHVSHLAVSAWPTAHHLMAEEEAAGVWSGKWRKTQP